jgi:transposase
MDFIKKYESYIKNIEESFDKSNIEIKWIDHPNRIIGLFVINNVSLGLFYSMLEYKCEWNDKQFVKIDRFFPSSKMCSKCGWINRDLTLKDREWKCSSCDETHDRDFNASKNILKQGLIILSGSGIESDIKQKQVEALPLGESMKPETH